MNLYYFGYAKGLEFAFSTINGHQTRLLVPMVKGQVANDHPTIVELKFQLPIIPAFFLLVLPLMFVPSFFTIDEIIINGVLREPTMHERIGWALFFMGVPALLYYLNCVEKPLKPYELKVDWIIYEGTGSDLHIRYFTQINALCASLVIFNYFSPSL